MHSLLFIPVSRGKLKKASCIEVDAVIFDLEDSVKAENKMQALTDLIVFLKTFPKKSKQIFVRLNADRMMEETEKLRPVYGAIDGFMIPKFESTAVLDKLKITDKKIIVLIETPKGLIRLRQIAESEKIWAIGFGAEDYTAATGMCNESVYLLPIKTELIKYARAFHKLCFDTVCTELSDLEKISREAEESRNIGFDGKLAIHPKQIPAIDKVFSSRDWEYDKKVLEAYNKSTEGVIVYSGKVYEQPHIEEIKKRLGIET